MQFKMPKPVTPGLCGNCVHATTQVATSGRLVVTCEARGEPRRVPEPLEYCQMYLPKDVFQQSLPKEMEDNSWIGVEYGQGKGQPRMKTFIPPDHEDAEMASMRTRYGGGWARMKKEDSVGFGGKRKR